MSNARIPNHRPRLTAGSDRVQASSYGWTSSNWSGYALSGAKGAFRRVSACWTVPFVRPSSSPSYSSAWIGIDGFNNSSLIQTGTGHDYVNGKAYYYAWWEILPAAATLIRLPVHPGDRIQAVIARISRSRWSIVLRNRTRNWTFRTIRRYNGPQSSAEWVVEAPQVGTSLSRLASLSPVPFSRCRVNGRNPRLTLGERGVMVRDNRVISIPTRPNGEGDAFVVKGTQTTHSPSYAYVGKPILNPRPR
ncbi:G1 family glutamic endopeptidase [Cohnella zeiphila]|uniref:Peptidase A4 family protein n=1 Tax=Cohnella zeiphila TaxID=2761120 RepID=A0A7X0SN05_9BACL|nr:G1 family glutamic endopeptidase [Cohnella zeiphila]MBB6733003.1 hypothetical protein [Cohnella zeiphila]